MKLSESCLSVVEVFELFYKLRKTEWDAKSNDNELTKYDYRASGNIVDGYHIEQAFPYSELELYKTCDLYDVLQEMFDSGKIDETFTAFAAFLIQVRGFPDPTWIEPVTITGKLHSWLFRNANSFKGWDFSFGNFEEAYKESCWRDWLENRACLV
jgi:hypothetical protein